MERWKTIGLLVILISVISGCTTLTLKAYEGLELPQEEVALITQKLKWRFPTIRIWSVDGYPLKIATWYWAVKPGQHYVKVSLFQCSGGLMIGNVYTVGECDNTPSSVLSFEAEANKIYVVNGENFEKPTYWIKDQESGEVVAREQTE